MEQKVQVSDFLVTKMLVFNNFLWILAKNVTFWTKFPLSRSKNSKSPSVMLSVPEYVAKNYFLSWNFLSYSTSLLTHFFIFFP